MPPASTICTTESGIIAMAPMWKIHEPHAISMPRANILEENSWRVDQKGRRKSTAGAARAPRCLYRKPRLVVSAQPSARAMPRIRVMEEVLCVISPMPSRQSLPERYLSLGIEGCVLEGAGQISARRVLIPSSRVAEPRKSA